MLARHEAGEGLGEVGVLHVEERDADVVSRQGLGDGIDELHDAGAVRQRRGSVGDGEEHEGLGRAHGGIILHSRHGLPHALTPRLPCARETRTCLGLETIQSVFRGRHLRVSR